MNASASIGAPSCTSVSPARWGTVKHSVRFERDPLATIDELRRVLAVVAAHHNGESLPLPHLLLGGMSFGGPFAGLSGRLGGQMGQAIQYNRVSNNRQAGSALGEAYIQQALEWQQMLEEGAPANALTGKVAQFYDANGRADKLARLASTLSRAGKRHVIRFRWA